MKPSEFVLRGIERISDPEKWAPGGSDHPRRCAVTSLYDWNEVTGLKNNTEDEQRTISKALTAMRAVVIDRGGKSTLFNHPIYVFNDTHTHREVLDMMYEAARRLKEQGD